ncbi:MAG TPA: RNA-binding protein [Candidatus Atribacteria bacterium]|nr:RNA-binding protein [Candidatus Atribacteria bacterium]
MQIRKLYVRNFKYSTENDKLNKLFSDYGKVKQVNIIRGRDFGFVEMSNIEEAKRVKKALDNSCFEGRFLKVDEAWPLSDIRIIDN